jgi:hypothetical protein
MRRFGSSMEDMAVEFRFAPRVDLITNLLELCLSAGGAPIERKFARDLPAGFRIEALLRLAELTDPGPFSWRLRCSSPDCGQESEFELTADEIVSQGSELREAAVYETEIRGHALVLRRPTGLDQAQWTKEPQEREAELMLRAILVRPTVEEMLSKGETMESIARAVDDALEGFDPLPGLHLDVVCPHCEKSCEVAPDLTGAALERLYHAQQALIEDVHRLASRYHWSEHQILELPAWRRQSYLDLIGETA